MKNSAVVYEGPTVPATIEVRDAPNYEANPREVVVRVEAVGLNPSDYRLRDGAVSTPKPHGGGSDVVGIVEQIGEGVQGFSLGERVAGYTPFHFSIFSKNTSGERSDDAFEPDSRYAAFQHQTVVFCEGIMKVPAKVSVPEAATLGCAYMTAALGIWRGLQYRRPTPECLSGPNQGKGSTLLIWGGSSCVGAYAVQFARVSGIRVVATASPHNFQYVKWLGAERVYDYSAPDVVERLRDEGIVNVLDAISTQDTFQKVRNVLRGRGGRVAAVLPLDMDWPPEIEHCYIGVPEVYRDDLKELARWLYHDFSPKFIGEGLVHPNNVHLVEGGLEKIKDMMYLQKEGKVSARKPVLLLKRL